VTVALERTVGAVACQTSASPGWLFARLTSVQVRPAPLTVVCCCPDPVGPSADTKARRTSPAAAVWNVGVVTVVLPCTLTSACITKHVIGGAGFCTVAVTLLDIPISPAVSVAFAERV
jgi:hypothetical protein